MAEKVNVSIYEGNHPYLYISAHANDKGKVYEVLEKLQNRGFRFWIDEGITPGMETDEILAEHIENSGFFVAFLSKSYLNSLDMVDELNYSRDTNKDYLLVYLDDAVLPAGLDMRFMRAQNIQAQVFDPESIYSRILQIDGADRYYGIADPKLKKKAENTIGKLESLYPEHKVYALHAIDKHLSEKVAELSLAAGYPDALHLLKDYGFEQITPGEARDLRSSVSYQPGGEPEIVKPRIDYIMEVLSADYPEKYIGDALEKSHKAINGSLQGLSVWMGYGSVEGMLSAYGFTMAVRGTGRKSGDYEGMIARLKERYIDKRPAGSLNELRHDNPDLISGLKTLSNRAQEFYGTTLFNYLQQIGVIEKPMARMVIAQREKQENLLAELKASYEEHPAEESWETIENSLRSMVIRKYGANHSYHIVDCLEVSEKLTIPYGITGIDEEAFSGQTDLETLLIPGSVKEIQQGAFEGCDGLETLVLDEGIERIGNEAFADCTSLKSIVLPASLKYLGNNAFAGCEALENVTVLNRLMMIEEDAFEDCIFTLDDLQEPDSSDADLFEIQVDRKNRVKILEYTGDEELVVVPSMLGGHPVVSIEKGCFKDNRDIREVYINDAIATLGGELFKDCTNLEKVHLPNAVSSLKSTVFSGCSALQEVNIPDSMEEVQRGLFKDAPLTTIYLGKGVKKLSPDAFYKGEADFATGMYIKKKVMEHVIVDDDNDCLCASGTMLLSKDGKVLVAELGDPLCAVIPEGVEEISDRAFERLSMLSEVVLPSSLKRIGEKAFAETRLKKVEFPKGLETIGMQAFSFCRVLEDADLNEGLIEIGQQAFEGCPIKKVFIPATVRSLGNDSFFAVSTYQGTGEQKFMIDTANEVLYEDGIALYQKIEDSWTLMKAYHRSLRSMPNETAGESIRYQVKEGTTTILAQAFARCNNLCQIELPEGLTTIGDLAFWSCDQLKQIHIPASCTELSPKAFFGTNIEMI